MPGRVTRSPVLRRTAEVTHGMLRGCGLAEPELTDAVRLLRTFHGYCADVRASRDRAVDALHIARCTGRVRRSRRTYQGPRSPHRLDSSRV
ncbi:hypothetical protein [Streptomyces sp. NPDC004629]|uniref:hypothetical protein n=1 Tax=Streptomyces sp. NPDC004629 TaxID=3364705 RepID=UPI003699CB47